MERIEGIQLRSLSFTVISCFLFCHFGSIRFHSFIHINDIIIKVYNYTILFYPYDHLLHHCYHQDASTQFEFDTQIQITTPSALVATSLQGSSDNISAAHFRLLMELVLFLNTHKLQELIEEFRHFTT